MSRRVVTWLAVSIASFGCGGGSGGGSGSVEVLEGSVAAQAALGAALSLASAFSVILIEMGGVEEVALTNGGVTAAASASASSAVVGGLRVGRRAVRVSCPLGGSIDGECRESSNRTTIRSVASDCAVSDLETGLVATSSGRIDVMIGSAGFCGRELPGALSMTTVYRDFSATLSDGDVVLEEFRASHLEHDLAVEGEGCNGVEGTVILSGDVSSRRFDGNNVSFTTEELRLVISSGGSPCREVAVASGRIRVDDLARGNRVRADLAGLLVSYEAGSSGAIRFALDGAAEIDCVGEVHYTTDRVLPAGGVCPADGAIDVTTPDGMRTRGTFVAGDVELDHGIDGAVDEVVASCVELVSCS